MTYLDVAGTPVLTHLHEPATPRRATGVLMVPPFGWDDVGSYRSRRAWAESLAAQGFPVLRLDLPGSGDSGGGPDDRGLVAASIAAVTTANEWLRAEYGCDRVAGIGIGLGGLYACVAASGGALFEDLVLWAVPGRGRTAVRELRAFARFGVKSDAADGALAVNGFLLSAETLADIEALDLGTLPPPAVTRALLLDRDGVPVDQVLHDALAHTAVTVAPGPGWAGFMALPQASVPPHEVVALVGGWLDQTLAADASPVAGGTDTVVVDGVREHVVGNAVVAEPDGPNAGLTAVLLNAGAIRRIGPNRMWVELARRWAARGVPTARVDLHSIGDAAGPDVWTGADAQFYDPTYGTEVVALLDTLAARGLPDRFVLLGLCSGAYWSFTVAQDDPRVVGAVLLNPLTFAYDPYTAVVRTSRVLRRAWQARGWSNLLRGRTRMANVVNVLRAAFIRLRDGRRQRVDVTVEPGLDRLRDKGVRTLLVFSNGEMLRDELAAEGFFERLDRWPDLTVRLLDGPTDVHTLQPLAVQAQVHALADELLDRLAHEQERPRDAR